MKLIIESDSENCKRCGILLNNNDVVIPVVSYQHEDFRQKDPFVAYMHKVCEVKKPVGTQSHACKECGTPNNIELFRCWSCGADDTIKCPKCGREIRRWFSGLDVMNCDGDQSFHDNK